MSIYVIADLHLSFEKEKPMSIFGDNWENHANKIKNNWKNKVTNNDYVILPGDFSWAMHLKETYKDFQYLNELPGKKILLKGNHDYWWTTLKNMREFVKENNFENIDFLYNNSYLVEDKIIVGTRGWNILDADNSKKMIKRECNRLELSLKDGIEKYGNQREIIAFMHYPPVTQSLLSNNGESEFIDLMKKYNIKRCYYGHLHGQAHKDAIEGNVEGIELKLISADYLDFDLLKL